MTTVIIGIIVPIHNGAPWIDACFHSILEQTALATALKLEVCVCNDCSTDDTVKLLKKWEHNFQEKDIALKIYNNYSGSPGGVGYSKNKAVSLCIADLFCFQDVDDVMLPNRIQKQYEAICACPKNTIIGSKFKRNPEDSTIRFTKWANSLTQEQLNLQVFTSHGPTVIMPTWFLSRETFKRVGGFVEDKKGTPEDLIFFYKHLDLGGKIHRVDECLVIYTFHADQTTFSIHEDTIWKLRVERLQETVLNQWTHFTIWNAGKQGKKLFNSLSVLNKNKVVAFCDVDKNKIGKKYIPYDPKKPKETKKSVDIIYFRDAEPPLVICVKMDLTGGQFEENLNSLNLREGLDYIIFS